jgi:hypothetical protein
MLRNSDSMNASLEEGAGFVPVPCSKREFKSFSGVLMDGFLIGRTRQR